VRRPVERTLTFWWRNAEADKEYDIGYGSKSPEESRFPKGKSGNPKDCLKGSRNTYKLLKDLLTQKTAIPKPWLRE
jgi:hypothetical protein